MTWSGRWRASSTGTTTSAIMNPSAICDRWTSTRAVPRRSCATAKQSPGEGSRSVKHSERDVSTTQPTQISSSEQARRGANCTLLQCPLYSRGSEDVQTPWALESTPSLPPLGRRPRGEEVASSRGERTAGQRWRHRPPDRDGVLAWALRPLALRPPAVPTEPGGRM